MKPANLTSSPLIFRNVDAWMRWLAKNHATSDGVWLKIAKKGSKQKSLTITKALDGALCHGWIDSQRKSLDADFYLQRYSRRRPKSPWSKINVDKIESLTRASRMHPAGIAEVEAAKADGRWDVAYLPQRDFELPTDVIAKLKKSAGASQAFSRLPKSERYRLLLPVLKATKPAVRQRQIEQLVRRLEPERARVR